MGTAKCIKKKKTVVVNFMPNLLGAVLKPPQYSFQKDRRASFKSLPSTYKVPEKLFLTITHPVRTTTHCLQ